MLLGIFMFAQQIWHREWIFFASESKIMFLYKVPMLSKPAFNSQILDLVYSPKM